MLRKIKNYYKVSQSQLCINQYYTKKSQIYAGKRFYFQIKFIFREKKVRTNNTSHRDTTGLMLQGNVKLVLAYCASEYVQINLTVQSQTFVYKSTF